MKLIRTRNFELAVNQFGDDNADKIALLLPGRLDTKDYINFTKHGEFLADKGFFAVAIDPPYTWDSPGDINNYCTTAYVKAVNELIEYFGNRPTLLLGHSRGGAVVMICSSNSCVEVVVLVNAAYNAPSAPDPQKIVGDFLVESRDLPPGNIRTEKQIKLNLPLNYFEDARKYIPSEYLRQYKGPKLLAHSKQDEFFEIGKVREIYESLFEPKALVELNGTHDYRLFPESIDAVNSALGELIDLHM